MRLLKRTNVSFGSSYQSEVVSGLGMECWYPILAQIQEGLMHAVTAASGSSCECRYFLLCLEGFVSLLSSIFTGSYSFSDSSFIGFPELYRKGVGEDIPFRIECSKFSHSLDFVVSLYLFPSTAGGSFFDDG